MFIQPNVQPPPPTKPLVIPLLPITNSKIFNFKAAVTGFAVNTFMNVSDEAKVIHRILANFKL